MYYLCALSIYSILIFFSNSVFALTGTVNLMNQLCNGGNCEMGGIQPYATVPSAHELMKVDNMIFIDSFVIGNVALRGHINLANSTYTFSASHVLANYSKQLFSTFPVKKIFNGSSEPGITPPSESLTNGYAYACTQIVSGGINYGYGCTKRMLTDEGCEGDCAPYSPQPYDVITKLIGGEVEIDYSSSDCSITSLATADQKKNCRLTFR
jgi:hypothetical protein